MARRILVAVGLLLLVAAAVLFFAMRALVLRSFSQLEREALGTDMARVEAALEEESSVLRATALDWSAWDDTRDFLVDVNEAYIAGNLQPASLETISVDCMIFLDTQGGVVYVAEREPGDALSKALVEHVGGNEELLEHPAHDDNRGGILLLEHGAALMAVSPITGSNMAPPVSGTLVMGRAFDTEAVGRLADRLRLSIEVFGAEDPTAPGDIRRACARMAAQDSLVIEELSRDVIAGYVGVADLYGAPALALRINKDRRIYREGLATTRLYLFVLLLGGAVTLVALAVTLNRNVSRPIAQFTARLETMRRTKDLSRQIEWDTDDELGMFAREFNRMTEALHETTGALSDSEQRYGALFESASDAIFIVQDGLLVDSNRKALELFGWAKEDLIGAEPVLLSPPVQPDGSDSPEQIRERIKEAFDGTSQVFGWRHQRRDGSCFDAEVSLSAVEVRGTRYIQAIVRDISERIHAEERLRESEERLRTIFETVPTGTIIVDPRTHRIVEANPVACRMFGVERSEVVGQICHRFMCPAQEGECPVTDLAKTVDWGEERVLVDRAGNHVPIVKNVTWIRLGGEPYLLESFLDISERKKADEALRKSEQLYRFLADNATDVIWTMDLEFRHTYVSPSVARLRGYSVEEAMAQPIEEVLTPESVARVKSVVGEALRASPAVNVFARTLHLDVRTKDGGTVPTEVSARLLRDGSGKATGILGVTRDITERVRAEADKTRLEVQLRHAQRLESIGILAGGLAHDFNNLLSPVIGYSEMLLGDAERDHPWREHLTHVLDAAERARALTQQLLAFSRKQVLETRILSLGALVAEFQDILRTALGEQV
ncbi:MAG: PAS domain S-box protein, partial [Candidatus Hydrogenedentes bacterium]|nr:PAS domain S-box protein [Candidatus Hydrogenedentota bacterium]